MKSESRSPSPENDVFALSIAPKRENKSASISSVDFDGLLQTPLLLYEDLKDGCGGQLWPAGMTLSRYMLLYHPDLTDKSIVEIGSGGGLVGLTVAHGHRACQLRKLLITDQMPMFALMQKNIELNNLQEKVMAAIYDWGSEIPEDVKATFQKSTGKTESHPDIVLAADCVYFEPAFPLLLQTLSDLIGPSTTCYFCFKKRRKADMRFIRDMKKRFHVAQIEYDRKELDQREGIWLFEVAVKRD